MTDYSAYFGESDFQHGEVPAIGVLLNLAPDHLDRYASLDRYFDEWHRTVAGPIDDVVAILTELRQTQVGLYALSNWSGDLFRRNQARFAFLDWFDGMMISGEERVIKPDPRIYRLLAERFDIDPATAVFIDDREDNVDAAREGGFTGVVFTSAGQLGRDLAELDLLEDPANVSRVRASVSEPAGGDSAG